MVENNASMKTLFIFFSVFSMLIFGQQKRNSELQTKNSLAEKNVSTIVDYSKKAYFKSGTDLSLKSDIKYNVNQLLINNNNFDNVNGGSYGDNSQPWSLLEPKLNIVNTQVRTLMSIPVYKSK